MAENRPTSLLNPFSGNFWSALLSAVNPDIVDTSLRNQKLTGAALFSALGLGFMCTPGVYPGATLPVVRTFAAASGDNIMYTVPGGRKAILLDIMVTNSTAGAIAYYPKLRTAAVNYRIGANASESAAGIGHNYGLNGTRGIPIVMVASESVVVNCDAAGLSIWCMIIEFDANAPIFRASRQTGWVVGENLLFTMPSGGKTLMMGNNGYQTSNNPNNQSSALVYVNDSGSTRSFGGFHIVPSAGSATAANQISGVQSLVNTALFAKFFHGGLLAGDKVIAISDSNAAGQMAWFNYTLTG